MLGEVNRVRKTYFDIYNNNRKEKSNLRQSERRLAPFHTILTIGDNFATNTVSSVTRIKGEAGRQARPPPPPPHTQQLK